MTTMDPAWHLPPEILIVEDNYLTATEVSDMVRECGYGVAGTAPRIQRGLELLDAKRIDGAIVDINLGGAPSFPLCFELDRRKVPYFFLTGYPSSAIPPDFRSAPMLSKPCDHRQIQAALDALVSHRPPIVPPPIVPLQPELRPAVDRGNHLLQRLDAAAWAMIEPRLERVTLAAGEVLEEKDRAASHVIFPVAGAISLEASVGKDRMQVALVGREGMVGTSLLLDDLPANDAVVQFSGAGWRMPADALGACLAHGDLHRQLLRGVNAFIARLSLTALANGRGTIEQRLARWLLTAAERLDSDVLSITHDRLAHVLGVRRAGVTVALHMLEGKHTLRAERRRLRILDRERLAAAAGVFRTR